MNDFPRMEPIPPTSEARRETAGALWDSTRHRRDERFPRSRQGSVGGLRG